MFNFLKNYISFGFGTYLWGDSWQVSFGITLGKYESSYKILSYYFIVDLGIFYFEVKIK